MDLDTFTLVSMITRRMAWLGQRQQTLAHNIANADTPGYQPRGLEPMAFQRMAAQEARR